MSNEELFEKLIREGTTLVRTKGEYSDYMILGLYRARRDIVVKMKSVMHGRYSLIVVDGVLPAEDLEPLEYLEAHNQAYRGPGILLQEEESTMQGLEE